MINITLGGMSGGYRAYLRNILPRLAAHDEVEAVLCAAPKSLRIAEWFGALPNVTFADSGRVRLFRDGPRAELRRGLTEFRPDVLFVPLARRFRLEDVPVVNMVQGMEPLAYDGRQDPLLEKIKNALRRRAAKNAAVHADALIAVSNFVRGFLVDNWAVPADRIAVAHYGPPGPPTRSVRPASVPEDWVGDFIFTAGAIRPARGLADLLSALGLMAARNVTPRLVIAGHTDPRMSSYRRKMESIVSRSCLGRAVIWAGSLSPEEMDWCYRNCKMLAMTSRVESFGMIAIEAMAAGCVCIAADNPCLPEVFGEAAVYYPPEDAAALAAAIERLDQADDETLSRMSAAALKQAARFSWDRCADKAVAQLAKAAGGRRQTR